MLIGPNHKTNFFVQRTRISSEFLFAKYYCSEVLLVEQKVEDQFIVMSCAEQFINLDVLIVTMRKEDRAWPKEIALSRRYSTR